MTTGAIRMLIFSRRLSGSYRFYSSSIEVNRQQAFSSIPNVSFNMQSNRRLPKRSVLGTRVSAPWTDGRFYSGVIDSTTEQPNGQYMYNVLFDDGYSKLFFHKDIVGQYFLPITSVFLKHGQKIYTTIAGREQRATVIKHSKLNNEVILEYEDSNGDIQETSRRLDDVWLLESRKSSRIVDLELHGPKRSPTNGIDVPLTRNRRRKHEEAMSQVSTEDADSDMQVAAMALQNLSCSPASPNFPIDLSKSPRSWNSDHPLSTFRSSPSPPTYSSSAPHSYQLKTFFGSLSTDEGIELEETIYPIDDIQTKRRKSETPVSKSGHSHIGTIYKCTWRGCRVKCDDCRSIESHIRQAHLGPKEDSDLSDHEEEFYYEEIEQNEMEEMTSHLQEMTCASPSQSSPLNLTLPRSPSNRVEHDYPIKPTEPRPVDIRPAQHDVKPASQPISVPIHQTTSPIIIPGSMSLKLSATPPNVSSPSSYVFPQNSPYSRQPIFKMSPQSPSTGSPKHTTVRKSRSDIKKCRKVYGMENKELWCTQCKWKKACTRFVPE